MNLNYYTLLGISKTSSEDQIIKAYNRAEQLHTTNNNTELLNKCKYAYDVLIDKNKRTIYDKFGELGLINKIKPLYLEIEFDIYDIYRGTNINIDYDINIYKDNKIQDNHEHINIEILIPSKTRFNDELILKNKGHKYKTSTETLYGDLIIVVKQLNNSNNMWGFNSNKFLTYKLYLNIREILLGFNIVIKHIDGSYINIINKNILENFNGSNKIIKNKGYNKNEPLILYIIPVLPKDLSESQKNALSNIFPNTNNETHSCNIDPNDIINFNDLSKYNIISLNKK